jgi:hypothetical protein
LENYKVSFPIRLAVFLASGRALMKLPNAVGFAKRPEFVMPDLIRHPEYPEVTGFRPSPE